MHSNCIKNLLNLKEVNIKSIKNFKNKVEIFAELPISEQVCPYEAHEDKISYIFAERE